MLLQWEALNFGISLVAGFLALAVVSLLTPPESKQRLDPFYERLDRRSRWDAASETEVEVRQPGHDLLFVHLFDLGLSRGLQSFYQRFRVDINGLLVAALVVVALIALAKGILFLP